MRLKTSSLLFALLFLPIVARSQTAVPITDVSERAHVTANVGGIFLTEGADWSGAGVGASLIYNLHPQASAFAGYDHGVPINSIDPSLNLWWAGANLKVHPNAAIGFGYVWFDKHTDGGLAQLVIAKKVMPRLSINGVAAHIFSRGDLTDFEYYRIYLNYHLIGKGS